MFPSLEKAIYQNQGDEWNQGGHFADADFHELIATFLPGLHLPDPAWTPDAGTVSTIQALISERSVAPKWGIKGMNAWIGAKILAGMGHDVRVIRTSRPVEQSQASYTERIGDAYKESAPAFVSSAKSLADAFYDEFPNDKKMTVDFDSIYDNTQTTVDSISAFAGVASTPEAVAFVVPSRRRFG
jgi:hypothetical protein